MTTVHVDKSAFCVHVQYADMASIFEQPYSRIDNVINTVGVQRQTASKYLKNLVAIGVLQERRAGKEKLFVNPALMALLAQDSTG